ncbi:hypothetical protein [Shewanella sp. WPAGA9]|nr:hypothetical protein [Shewanella sp. WPAGA9]
MPQLSIHEKYLHPLSQTSDLMTVAEWAEKVGQVYPDLLNRANQ